MIRQLIILFCSLMLVASCSQKPDTNAVLDFYGKMQAAMLFYKDEQQNFINKTTDAINDLQYDRVVDTKTLRLLLDTAKMAMQSRRETVDTLKEIDEEIGYKQKMINYIDTFSSAYNHEFPDFITMLESDKPKGEKVVYLTEKLKSKLLRIQECETEVKNAKEAMLSKYKLDGVDEMMDKVNEMRKENFQN